MVQQPACSMLFATMLVQYYTLNNASKRAASYYLVADPKRYMLRVLTYIYILGFAVSFSRFHILCKLKESGKNCNSNSGNSTVIKSVGRIYSHMCSSQIWLFVRLTRRKPLLKESNKQSLYKSYVKNAANVNEGDLPSQISDRQKHYLSHQLYYSNPYIEKKGGISSMLFFSREGETSEFIGK